MGAGRAVGLLEDAMERMLVRVSVNTGHVRVLERTKEIEETTKSTQWAMEWVEEATGTNLTVPDDEFLKLRVTPEGRLLSMTIFRSSAPIANVLVAIDNQGLDVVRDRFEVREGIRPPACFVQELPEMANHFTSHFMVDKVIESVAWAWVDKMTK